jgi:DNA-binding CsgD family transcriptional regulator/tetratricopeptide (TPR) repeat protein
MGQEVVGRTGETRSGARFLSALGSDEPGVLGIVGPAGIGKTTVWRHVLRTAGGAGCRVLAARPGPTEKDAAFGVLTDLLRTVDDDALAELPAPQLRALSAALLRGDPDLQVDPQAVCAAVLTLVARLADDRSVVLAVDDMQWADPSSVRVLDYVARRVEGLRVGLVLATRVSDDDDGQLGLPPALFGAQTRELILTPLAADSLGQIIHQQLGRTLPLRSLLRVQTLSGGNPLFALELARALPDDRAGYEAFELPLDLRELTNARIERLPEGTRRALVAAAAQDSPTVDLVASALEVVPSTVAEDLDSAVAAGLVAVSPGSTAVHFSHPLYAVGVLELASPQERRSVHRRLAQVVPGLEERARHAALGSAGTDSAIAALLDVAADLARRRGAPGAAAELAVQARDKTPADCPEDRARRSVAVASYCFHAGDLRKARTILEALTDPQRGSSVRGEALGLLGEVRYHQDSFPQAMVLFEAALACQDLTPRLACRIQLHMAYGEVASGNFEAGQVHSRRALERLETVTDDALLANALAVATIADYMVGEGLDENRLNRALALEDPFAQVAMSLRPSLIAGYLMLFEGRLAHAESLLTGCREAARQRGDESDIPLVSSCLSWVEVWQGRLEEAERYAQEALDISRLLGSEAAECLALAYASVPAAFAGRTEQARMRAGQAMALAPKTGVAVANRWAAWGLSVAGLMDDDATAVHAALGEFIHGVEEFGLPEPVSAMFLADEIEALVALGELRRADHLTDLLEETARRHHRSWALVAALRSRALLHFVEGALDAAALSADEALQYCAGLELRIEVGRTLLLAGRIARRRKQKGQARGRLEQAVELFAQTGCQVLHARAVAELERVGGHGALLLTATEQQVAALSASGLTNRAVAAQMGISPKTVESNLSRTYRKLGIRSRAELGSRLGHPEEQPKRRRAGEGNT